MADNKKMILNLFSGLQDALFLGDRFSKGEFVSFLQPGQFVSPNLVEAADSNDMAIQSEIANILVDSSYVNKYDDITYSNSVELLGSVNQVYYDVLHKAALPYTAQDTDTLAEIERLRTWLQDRTKNYEDYRDRYFDAVEAYEFEAAKQEPNPGRLRRLAQKKTDAYNHWNTFGDRDMYKRKFFRFSYLIGENPTTFWGSLGERMQDQQQNAPRMGTYYQTFFNPPISSWSSASWAQFEREIKESDTYEHSKATSWSGGISGSWGLWSWGGGTSGSTNYQHREAENTSVYIKVDYLRVRIFRPWLVDDVFGYKFWTWKKEFGLDRLSDGGNLAVEPPVRPIGRMPILPKYLIVVRNVELSASFSKDTYDWYHREVKASASVGWGPFSLSGSYAESEDTKHTSASFDGVTFRIQHPQIIARTGIMLPRSPDPNIDLPWQDDAWLPSEKSDDQKARMGVLRAKDYTNNLELELKEELNQKANKVNYQWKRQREKEIEQKVNDTFEKMKTGIINPDDN